MQTLRGKAWTPKTHFPPSKLRHKFPEYVSRITAWPSTNYVKGHGACMVCMKCPPPPTTKRRWRDPVKWQADRMAEEAKKRARRNDPAYLAEKREERRQM